ncbi:minor capsid protein [Megasphaera hexanoica]|nr:minor capsid protein [Megasphaera hexanoica]
MTNKDYWQRRFERLEQREMDKADQAMAELKKVYEYTLRQLRDEVIEWYTRYADENGLSLADARKQLDTRELKAFKLTLKEYEKLAKQQDLSDEYIKMLDQASIRARLSRSQMLYIKTANYVEQLAKQQEINLTELLKDVYEDSYYRTAYETQSMQGRYDTFSEVPKTSIEKTISRPWAEDGKDFSERIWDNKTKLLNTLQSEITRTLIAAEGTTLLAGRIANRFNVSFSNAKRLAETETAYVQETARMDTWQKLHVAKYELIATLDSRTSPICREMDGKVFDRADAKPGVTMPPFHCYCRTTTAPYIEGITDDDDSTRVARDPDTGRTVQVPGKMKYGDWKAVFVDKSKTLAEWRDNLMTTGENSAILNSGREKELEQAKKRDHKIYITDIAIEKVPYVHVPGLTKADNEVLQVEHQRLLKLAKTENNSNEVSIVLCLSKGRNAVVFGDEVSVNAGGSPEAMGVFRVAGKGEIMYLHNHPTTSNFSFTDIATFLRESQIGVLSVVTNQGTVYVLSKNKQYNFKQAVSLFNAIAIQYKNKILTHEEAVKAFLRACKEGGIDYVRSK